MPLILVIILVFIRANILIDAIMLAGAAGDIGGLGNGPDELSYSRGNNKSIGDGKRQFWVGNLGTTFFHRSENEYNQNPHLYPTAAELAKATSLKMCGHDPVRASAYLRGIVKDLSKSMLQPGHFNTSYGIFGLRVSDFVMVTGPKALELL